MSRKRRRYQRKPQAGPCGSRALGKRKRAQICDPWREERDDPLTKLRVFKSMKKGKQVAKEPSEDSVSDIEAAMVDVDEEDDDDERMELSDIEWYTRQMAENEWDEAQDEKHDDELDDLDMSEVELGVMASPRRLSPEPEPYKPIVSFAEVNNVPSCLYRPLADIIDEVYTHLGLDTDNRRGVKLLHNMLGERKPRTKQELGSVGVFPTRPMAAQDWAALNLSRKIIRRDRMAKCTIYRFTFAYPKDLVPSRFLDWQTWNHPTLGDIRHGLRLKLDEAEAEREVQVDVDHVPSSPAAIEEELDDEVDDILSEVDSLDEDEESEAVMTEVDDDDLSESDEDEDDAVTATVATEIEPPIQSLRPEVPPSPNAAAEDEALYAALGLAESPRRIASLPRVASTAIYSRLSRTAPDSPPQYTERMYRDRSPTPPPPFNAQTDNTVLIAPRFSPAAVVPSILPRLLPPFALSVSPTPSPSRRRTRPVARVTSGEIIMPGSFARPATRPPTVPVAAATPAPNSFDLALDMEEAETALELVELPASEAEAEIEDDADAARAEGLVSWGTSLVRSWWSR